MCFFASTLRRWDKSAAIEELSSFLGIGTKQKHTITGDNNEGYEKRNNTNIHSKATFHLPFPAMISLLVLSSTINSTTLFYVIATAGASFHLFFSVVKHKGLLKRGRKSFRARRYVGTCMYVTEGRLRW